MIIFTIAAALAALVIFARGFRAINAGLFFRILTGFFCLYLAVVVSPFYISREIIRGIALGLIFLAVILIISDFLKSTALGMNKALLGKKVSKPLPPYLDEVIKALGEMAPKKIGALIIIRQKDNLRGHVSGGITIDAQVKSELLTAIFSKSSPVHDGAVVISDGRVKRIKGVLSISTRMSLPYGIGTRHRAAVGVTEKTDCIALVVSEERGDISIACGGQLIGAVPRQSLAAAISRVMK
jgi:diadenylate cyclase